MGKQALRKALEASDEAKTLELMSRGIEATEGALYEKLTPLYAALIEDAGQAGAADFNEQFGFEQPKVAQVGVKFDVTNPTAVAWVETHAAETITGITEATRQAVRDLVEDAFTQQFSVRVLAKELTTLLGDKVRAETIARTETLRASNAAQQLVWQQARVEGKLMGTEKKEWIVTPDDRLCPICEPLEGERVGVGEQFSIGLEAPPAHPNCRCTIGLVK